MPTPSGLIGVPARFRPTCFRNVERLAAQDLVLGMLNKDQSRRYTAKEVLAHPWITQVRRLSAVSAVGRQGEIGRPE